MSVHTSSISSRAVFIGLICAALECLIAPYNDYVIRNVFLAGGHFPVGPFFVFAIFDDCGPFFDLLNSFLIFWDENQHFEAK